MDGSTALFLAYRYRQFRSYPFDQGGNKFFLQVVNELFQIKLFHHLINHLQDDLFGIDAFEYAVSPAHFSILRMKVSMMETTAVEIATINCHDFADWLCICFSSDSRVDNRFSSGF